MGSSISLFKRLLTFSVQAASFIYPPLCIYCEEETHGISFPLCPACTSLLELIPENGRCRRCFVREEKSLTCMECRKPPAYFHRHLIACSRMGPAQSLWRRYEQGEFTLSQAISSYMVLQYLEKKLPLPDLIVPISGSFFERRFLGKDHHEMLAKECSRLLGRPVCELLSYHWKEEGAEFSLKMRYADKVVGKHILLITGVFQREEVEVAAMALRNHFVQTVDVLSFLDFS